MDIANVHQNDKEVRAIELLEKVGLDQDQIILADEPTGNLDSDTWDEIMDIFDDLKEQGKCIIIVTHSKEMAQRADKVYAL